MADDVHTALVEQWSLRDDSEKFRHDNPFDPKSMYTIRNQHNPYQPWNAPRGPHARPSLQAANISPQASITVAEQPNVGRTTGSLYDFSKNAPTDNSELFSTDVAGQRARERMSG